MIEIFKHTSSSFVHHIKNILENHQIACILEQAFDPISTLTGGRILLLDEEKLAEAKMLIESVFSEKPDKPESWICRRCKKEIQGQFEECWFCAGQR